MKANAQHPDRLRDFAYPVISIGTEERSVSVRTISFARSNRDFYIAHSRSFVFVLISHRYFATIAYRFVPNRESLSTMYDGIDPDAPDIPGDSHFGRYSRVSLTNRKREISGSCLYAAIHRRYQAGATSTRKETRRVAG